MTDTCEICRTERGSTRLEVFDQSGSVSVTACEGCFEATLARAESVPHDRCLFCWSEVGGKYRIQELGSNDGDPHARMCDNCRGRVVFNEYVAIRDSGDRTERYDARGSPLPFPSDACDICYVLREERPEGFSPEVTTPYGEAEYLCGSCRDAGRGMK